MREKDCPLVVHHALTNFLYFDNLYPTALFREILPPEYLYFHKNKDIKGRGGISESVINFLNKQIEQKQKAVYCMFENNISVRAK